MACFYEKPYVSNTCPHSTGVADPKTRGSWLGFINAVQSLGAVVLYPVVAWSANRFGRKKTVGIGYFWLLLGVGLQTGATGSTMFVIGRLCIGGVSAFFSVAPILITEIAFPTHRAIATAFFNCGWYIGSLVAAWATYGTRNDPSSWSWRVPSILQVAVPVVAAVGFLMAPESPRWLISVGRHQEARDVLVKCHAGGDVDSPLAAYEFEEISRTLQLEKEVLDKVSYLDLFKTKGRRHRSLISITLGVFAQWNGGMCNPHSLKAFDMCCADNSIF